MNIFFIAKISSYLFNIPTEADMEKFDFILVGNDWLTICINNLNLENFGLANKIISILNGKEAVEYIMNTYKYSSGKMYTCVCIPRHQYACYG